MLDSTIEYIHIDRCKLFKEDLFRYDDSDALFMQLVHSIGTIGLINPIVARRVGNYYEVVVGRSRFRAIKYLGIYEIQAIVRDLNDIEAEILVFETNINQRGIDNLKHSQVAELIYRYHSLLKKQGRRSDLLIGVQRVMSEFEYNSIQTYSQVGEKLNSAVESGKKFNLSARTISRYLRIYLLCDDFKELLDDGCLSLRTAVELSFIDKSLQTVLYDAVQDRFEVKYENAVALRRYYQMGVLNKDNITNVLNGMRMSKPNFNGFKPMKKLFDKYSLGRFSSSELEALLDEALYLYFVEVQGDCSKVNII